MRVLAALSALLAAGLGVFSCWGLNTVAGQHAYDELDGYYPFFSGLASGVLALVAAFAWWRAARGRRASGRPTP